MTDSARPIGAAAVGSFAVNAAGQVLALCVLVVLTRLMSPESFGAYAMALSAMMLVALPFSGGFLVFVLRHVSAYTATSDWARAKGFLLSALGWVAAGTLAAIAVGYLVLPFFTTSDGMRAVYTISLWIVPFLSLMLLSGAVLRGLKHVVYGRLAEFIVQPGVLLLCLAGWAFFSSTAGLSASQAMVFHVLSLTAALALGLAILVCLFPKDICCAARAAYEPGRWMASALPLIFSIGLIVVNSNIDVVMVGALAGPGEAGYYRASSRLAAFIPFFLMAANNAAGPYISALHEKRKNAELQKILTQTARLTFLLTLPVAAILFIWPETALGLFFGASFVVAAPALVILASANLFSVAMGQVGQVAALTGQEKLSAAAVLFSTLINIGLNLILIPLYGMMGAAVATGVSIVVWNAVLAWGTVRRTGLHCTALGVVGDGLRQRK